MSRRIDDLDPDVQLRARAFIGALRAAGVEHVVTSTKRTTAEQIALYAQGRTDLEKVNALREDADLPPLVPKENRYVVTNCDGVSRKSRHQSGRALDVVPADKRGNPFWPKRDDPRWAEIGIIGESCGFTWGGRWEFQDNPHYEM